MAGRRGRLAFKDYQPSVIPPEREAAWDALAAAQADADFASLRRAYVGTPDASGVADDMATEEDGPELWVLMDRLRDLVSMTPDVEAEAIHLLKVARGNNMIPF